MNRPKAIGTQTESAVVHVIRRLIFAYAERRALRGTLDCGDITGTPGIAWEVKGGDAARNASDAQINAWLDETETERVNARADIGVLVVQRKGIGPGNADRWWAIIPFRTLGLLTDGVYADAPEVPVRLHLGDLCALLRWAGYGSQPTTREVIA